LPGALVDKLRTTRPAGVQTERLMTGRATSSVMTTIRSGNSGPIPAVLERFAAYQHREYPLFDLTVNDAAGIVCPSSRPQYQRIFAA
jgi:hypothetical protein